MDGKLTLKYIDETGLSLMLSVCSSWFARGRGKQFKIPTRWGSQGRINLLGSLSLHAEQQQLEYRLLDGKCTRVEVVKYLETLVKQCQPDELTVVVLDNAGFHKGGEIERRRAGWEQQGLFLRYLPPYCPFLNLIEGTWRKCPRTEGRSARRSPSHASPRTLKIIREVLKRSSWTREVAVDGHQRPQ